MKQVTLYTSKSCPFCIKAKALLTAKGVDFKELQVDVNPDYIAEAMERSGGLRTVPQIFIEDFHVGGCDELHALEKEGKLDGLLVD